MKHQLGYTINEIAVAALIIAAALGIGYVFFCVYGLVTKILSHLTVIQ